MKNYLKWTDMDSRIFTLALPNIVSNMSTPLIGLVDTFVAGHIDRLSLDAMAIGTGIFTLLYNIFVFLRKGTTGLTAQAYGRRDIVEVKACAVRSLSLAVIIGVVIILLQSWCLWLIFLWIRPHSEAVKGRATEYYYARVLGAPFALANYAVQGWLNGVQRARNVLCQQLTLNLSNAVLCIILATEVPVVGFGLGVRGIGYAAALANTIALFNGLGQMWYSIKLIEQQTTQPALVRTNSTILSALLDFPKFLEIATINTTIMFRSFCLTIVQSGFTAAASSMEDTILAADQLLLNMQSLVAMGIDGFSNAAEALVGEAIGARSLQQLRASVERSMFWGILISLGFSILWLVLGDAFFAAMTTDEETRSVAHEYLFWLVVGPLLSVGSYLVDGFFVGATLSKEMMYTMVVAMLGFFGIQWLFVKGPLPWGNNGLWTAFYSFLLLRAFGAVVFWGRFESKASSSEPLLGK